MKRSELRALIAEEIQYVLKGGTVNEDTVTLKKMNDINHTRLVKWLHNQFADKYAAALKSLDAASTKGNFTLDVSNWDKKDIAVLKKYLKSQDYMFEGILKEAKDIVFSVDHPRVDSLLNTQFADELDYKDIKGDSYYQLSAKQFDRFMDAVISRGMNPDAVQVVK